MKIVKAGILYFVLVFGAGFLFGPIRILWAIPRFGVRTSELMEFPFMLAVIIFAARWIVRRFHVPFVASNRLGVGCTALLLLLIAEFSVGLWIRGISIKQYFASLDPVVGTVYYLMLGVFALMPFLVNRR
ncbi:MAG: hypothetical protein JST85_06250 [Acidobacteria bacterium]|nr:hypothetical protein [Acidobacteriota bacterium]